MEGTLGVDSGACGFVCVKPKQEGANTDSCPLCNKPSHRFCQDAFLNSLYGNVHVKECYCSQACLAKGEPYLKPIKPDPEGPIIPTKSEPGVSSLFVDGDETLNLFEFVNPSLPEQYIYVRLVAPTLEKKLWKNREAIGAYCTACKKRVRYITGDTKQIARHMKDHHAQDMEEYCRRVGKTLGTAKRMTSFESTPRKRAKKAAPAEIHQKAFDEVVAFWTASSLQPVAVVEEESFRQVIEFAGRSGGTVAIPSKDANRKNVEALAHNVRELMKKMIPIEVGPFCVALDIEEDQMLTVVIHFISKKDWKMKSLTLAVTPITSEDILGKIKKVLTTWGLEESNMSMVIRSGDQAIVRASESWGIEHMNCILYCLDKIVTPVLIPSGDPVVEDGSQQIQDIVARFRALALFIQHSPQAKSRLEQIKSQCAKSSASKASDSGSSLTIKLDIKKQWGSVYSMLKELEKLQPHLDVFFLYLSSDEGSAEIGNANDVVKPSERDWAVLRGITSLVGPFYEILDMISGTELSTYSIAMPMLRYLMMILAKPVERKFLDGSETLDTSDKEEVYSVLDSARQRILTAFTSHFSSMGSSILWITILDPRFKGELSHLSDEEKKEAVATLKNECAKVVLDDDGDTTKVALDDNGDTAPDTTTTNSLRAKLFRQIPCPPEAAAGVEDDISPDTKKAAEASKEVDKYLAEERCLEDTDPVVWWQSNSSRFRRISLLARKWLCIPATSNSRRRIAMGEMDEDLVYDQILVHDNAQTVNLKV